jgi:serine/threonine protein kinase/DNA-binding beta-propeller fold protein YncE
MEPGGLRHTAEAGDEVTEETPGSGRFRVGSRIAGYRLDEVTGRGGMAVVYRAYDTRLERPVALKLLAPDLARDAAFRQRFIRESRTAAAVDHPNIIPIFEAGEADGVLFIAMRFVHGRDVQSLVNDGGPLPVVQACHIISQVAAGLEAAHAHGLVHRDVKPGNILLDGSASFPGHAYLSDFGLSKRALSDSALTSTGQFLGTVDYIAPEQIEGRPVDARTDEYALACTAFTMLTGAPPFTRDESVAVMWAQMSAPPPALTSRRPELPAAVNEVMAKALAKVPVERYATCPQFADALRRACGLEPGAHGPGPQPTQMAGPEPTQESGWQPGRPGAADPGPPSHPGTDVSGAPLAGPPHPGTEVSGAPLAGPPHPGTDVSGAPLAGPAEDVTSPRGPENPIPPGGQDDPGTPGPAEYPAASSDDQPGRDYQPPSEDPDYAGLWRANAPEPAAGLDALFGPNTEGVPPASPPGGPRWPGSPPPRGPGYPGPGRRPSRRRWQTGAGVAVGAAAVLAAGAFFLIGRGNGTSQNTAESVLQAPGCTTQVAKAAQLKHLSRHMTSTGGQPFDVAAVSGFAFVSIVNGVAVLNTSQPVPQLMRTAPMKHAQGEALTPDGQYLLVSSGNGLAVFRVSDLENGAANPVGKLSSPGQQHAVEVAVTPDGHYALVTYQNTSNVGVFNLHRALHKGFSPADLVGLIPVGPQPIGVAVAPNGGLAYVTSQPRQASASGNGVVNVISVAKAETRPAASVIKTVSAGCKPSRVVVSADGQQLWVTAGGSNALLGFSAPKLLSDPGHALLARVPVGPLPLGLMIINHGSRIVVADSDRDNQPGVSPSLAVVDVGKALAGQPALLGYAQAGTTPRQFAMVRSGSTLLVTNTNSGQLESLNAAKLP